MTKVEIVEGFPETVSGVQVDWDDYATGRNETRLWTGSLGPCLALSIYSPVLQIGTLAHLSQRKWPYVPGCMYPENVVDTLAAAITADYATLEATLAGESQGEIGISAIIKKRLEELKIPVVGEDIGIVPIGREVHLDCNSGNVTVYRYQ